MTKKIKDQKIKIDNHVREWLRSVAVKLELDGGKTDLFIDMSMKHLDKIREELEAIQSGE